MFFYNVGVKPSLTPTFLYCFALIYNKSQCAVIVHTLTNADLLDLFFIFLSTGAPRTESPRPFYRESERILYETVIVETISYNFRNISPQANQGLTSTVMCASFS